MLLLMLLLIVLAILFIPVFSITIRAAVNTLIISILFCLFYLILLASH